MKSFKYILASVLLVNLGNLLVKYGLNKSPFQFSEALSSLSLIYTSPFVLFGLLAIGTSSLFWLAALSRADLSYAYPMISMGYVITALLAWFFFDENLTLLRMAGIFVICSGVFLMSRSEVRR